MLIKKGYPKKAIAITIIRIRIRIKDIKRIKGQLIGFFFVSPKSRICNIDNTKCHRKIYVLQKDASICLIVCNERIIIILFIYKSAGK